MPEDFHRIRDKIDAHVEQDREDHRALMDRIDSVRDLLDTKIETMYGRLDSISDNMRAEIKANFTEHNKTMLSNLTKTAELRGEFKAKASIFGLLGGLLPALVYAIWQAF